MIVLPRGRAADTPMLSGNPEPMEQSAPEMMIRWFRPHRKDWKVI
jgi:hypothetical protein